MGSRVCCSWRSAASRRICSAEIWIGAGARFLTRFSFLDMMMLCDDFTRLFVGRWCRQSCGFWGRLPSRGQVKHVKRKGNEKLNRTLGTLRDNEELELGTATHDTVIKGIAS